MHDESCNADNCLSPDHKDPYPGNLPVAIGLLIVCGLIMWGIYELLGHLGGA